MPNSNPAISGFSGDLAVRNRATSSVRNLGDRACVANVGRAAGEQADVPAVLGDGVRGATVGFELDEEPVEGVVDGHGWPPWGSGLEF